MDNHLVALLSHSNFSVSVEAARIVVNLQDFDTSSSTLINLLPNIIQRLCDTKPKKQKVFCKAIVDYCENKSTSDEDVRFIIGQVINSTTTNSSSFKIVYGMKVNYSIRYNIALMAFQYGHWREVALPLLQIF
uniref:Uncharacterized protein n=2 Tax=Panagrolaimus TaxID=55784 RepID=A0A914QLP1_9BILA